MTLLDRAHAARNYATASENLAQAKIDHDDAAKALKQKIEKLQAAFSRQVEARLKLQEALVEGAQPEGEP